MFAAGVFKGAEDERAATVVLHVIGQVLSGDVGCAALVWALDRKPRAVVLVVLQERRQRWCDYKLRTENMSLKHEKRSIWMDIYSGLINYEVKFTRFH